MIRCTVLLFAQIREAAGRDQLSIELNDGSRVEQLIERLGDEHGSIATSSTRLAVAVNERYVGRDCQLHDGDVVALIPPVSGG